MNPRGPIRQVSRQVSIQAPIGGVNSISVASNMPQDDAILLRNFIAQPYGVKLRGGYTRYSTISGNPAVESIMPYNARNGSEKLFCVAANGNMYDSTSAGPVGAALVTGLTNARFQHVIVSNSAGTFLLAANGADNWIKYDGTTVSRVTNTDITNVNPQSIISLEVHQRRLWMVEKNTSYGWYLAPDAISGAATKFDFGPMFKRGGFLTQIVTWTVDAGEGSDDHLCAISSKGEVAIYSGIDPSNASTWACKGVFYIGSPVGRRCAKKTGGDVAIITEYGLVALTENLISTKLNAQSDGVAWKIQNLISNAVSAYRNDFGWEVFLDPTNNITMINCPTSNADTSAAARLVPGGPQAANQFVMNSITKNWTTYVNVPAYCWGMHKETPFFGGPGYVAKFNEGNMDAADYLGVGGSTVVGKAIQAFSYFGEPGRQKQFKMIRPVFVSQGDVSWRVEVRVDFDTTIPADPPSTIAAGALSYFDASLWDTGLWSGTLNTYQKWSSAVGIGFAGTISLSLTSNADAYWTSTDWVYEVGGVF